MRSRLKMRYGIALLLTFLGLGVYLLSININTLPPFVSWLSILVIASAVILNFTIRCPSCGKHLTGKNTWGIPHYCPNCGLAISDEEE